MKKHIYILLLLIIPSAVLAQFAKNVGGTSFDYPHSIAVDGSGNSYITGRFFGTADFEPGSGTTNLISAGSTDIFFAKYTAVGSLIWAYNFGSTSGDIGYGVAVDGSGNVYITGHFVGTVDFEPGLGITNLTSASSQDIFFAKYAADGTLIWAKSVGGTSTDDALSIAVDGSGNCYITGLFAGTADFDPGPGITNLISLTGSDIFFAKYTPDGNFIWAKNVDNYDGGIGNSISVDFSGNAYITGNFSGSADFDPGPGETILTSIGNLDIFFAKYAALDGALIWAKSVGGTGTDNADGKGIAVDPSGNAYITGYFNGTADFDPGAGTTSLTSVGVQDVFFAKYATSDGTLIWAKNIGSTSADEGTGIAVDGIGNTYITGYFNGTADFDPGPGTTSLTSYGGADIFFAKYAGSDGSIIWAKSAGGTSAEEGISIAVDGIGNTYITGYFLGTADFDPGAGTTNLTSAGAYEVFIAKYSPGGLFSLPSANFNINIFLEGPYNTNDMNSVLDLSSQLSHPYPPSIHTGTESVIVGFFASHLDIVDWVVVELRTGTSEASKVASRAAFLKSDGSIVDLDGTSDVLFDELDNTIDYYIVVHHRNHLPAMSASAVPIN